MKVESLLGRHVIGRPLGHRLAARRRQVGRRTPAGQIAEPGQAEVEDLDQTAGRRPRAVGDDQVGRLDVAVDQPALVSVLGPRAAWRTYSQACSTGRGPERCTMRSRSRPSAYSMTRVSAGPMGPGLIGVDDIGMGELTGGLDLPVEPLDGFRVAAGVLAEHLQRHQSAHLLVTGLVDLPGAAVAQRLEDDGGAEDEMGRPPLKHLLDLEGGQPAAADQFVAEGLRSCGCGFLQLCDLLELGRFQESVLVKGEDQGGGRSVCHGIWERIPGRWWNASNYSPNRVGRQEPRPASARWTVARGQG